MVPYCPALTLKFDAHINVELCTSVQVIKYIYTYVYKGHNRAVAGLAQSDGSKDEITSFVEACYLGSCEAAWSIFALPITERFPSVLRLALHGPNGQIVYYSEGEAAQQLQASGKTALTEFFAYNATAPDDDIARRLLYHDFPGHFTWNRVRK